MKKIIPLILSLSLILFGCSNQEKSTTSNNNSEYIKSIWIAYYELMEFTKGNDKDKFSKEINTAFKEIKDYGFNTVTVQIRPCSDAFYKSSIFPTSIYFSGSQDDELKYDPLEIMCNIADEYKLNIEAWINPYRVSQDSDFSLLSNNNPASIWHNDKDKEDYVVEWEEKIYYNPAYSEVTDLIVNGVVEIVKNYDIYAIHFDDYFYPTANEDFDYIAYSNYLECGGELSLDDWRRSNVTNMIKSVYHAIKKTNSNVRFGISPASNIENDYNSLYADIYSWIENKYVDYFCPQIYFGFTNVYQPFMITTKKWVKLLKDTDIDLYIGLPLYKSNLIDEYAAENNEEIKNEFINNNDIISRQIKYISNFNKITGYYIFSYSYLNSEQSKDEVSNMLDIMQSNNH